MHAGMHSFLSPSSLTKLEWNTSLQRLSARSVGPREFIFIQMYYAQGWSDHRQFELSLHPQENSFHKCKWCDTPKNRKQDRKGEEKKERLSELIERRLWAAVEMLGLERRTWAVRAFLLALFLLLQCILPIEQQAVATCWRGKSDVLSTVWDYNNCFYGNKKMPSMASVCVLSKEAWSEGL